MDGHAKYRTPARATRPQNSLANSCHEISEKAANYPLRIDSLALANGFANEMAKISFSLQKLLGKSKGGSQMGA